MQDVIDAAKANFTQARDGIARALAATPDDRINWSPAPTARTPIQLVAHAALAVKHINGMLDGRPFAVKTMEEADKGFREWEQQFTTREEVLTLLEESGTAYLAWLDALTPDRLDTLVEAPFGLGSVPVRIGLTFPPLHTQVHAAQIDYIQTVYGDREWH